MRTVSFSDPRVQKILDNDFVCCYTNTKGDPSAGASFNHATTDEPGPCGRGAGRQNVQTIFMTPDNEIFHIATGFLSPDDLLDELDFARDVFTKMQRHPKRRAESIVDAHGSRLKKLGFSRDQITARDDHLTDVMLSGPNPQDFGIKMPKMQDFGVNIPGGRGTNFFQDVSRQRILKDDKFTMRNPLLSRQDFEKNPQSLVGHHKSFFGTHSSMNGIDDLVNDRMNTRRAVRRP